jgi:hypothetical protein
MPVPDLNDAESQQISSIKRVAAKMPPINATILKRLTRFTKKFLDENFSDKCFSTTEKFDFYEWIEGTPYTQTRKQELIETYEKSRHRLPKKIVKAFTKDESYPEYKAHRGIYSRHDEYKCRVGPFFQKAGDILFKSKYFIKKIPVDQRPAWLMQTFGSKPNVSCTDFTAFESTFVDQLMMSVEFQFYRYLLHYNPMKKELMDLITEGLTKENIIMFREWMFSINAKRMSGEMNTSLGNGFFNLIVTFFLLEEQGNKNYDGRFEGDDGIFWYDETAPTTQDYANIGARIKIETPSGLNTASFCGMIFDIDVLDNITDPIKAVMTFGYTDRKYLKAGAKLRLKLLAAKSLSMLYTYPGCPMLRELAMYGIRICNIPIKNISMIGLDKWKVENILIQDPDACLTKTVDVRSRILMEEKFGISISDQLGFEDYIKNKNDFGPIEYDLNKYINKDCIDCWQRFIQENNPKHSVRELTRVYPRNY